METGMDNLTPQPSTGPKPGWFPSLSPREILMGVAVLVLLALIGWLAPSRSKLIHERDSLKAQVEKLSSETETETFYPSGVTQTRTITKWVHETSTTNHSKDFTEKITQRGTSALGAAMNLKREPGAVGHAQLLGPLELGGILFPGSFDGSAVWVALDF